MDRLKQFITSGFSEVRSSFGQHASLGGFSIPDKMAWKKDLDDRWKERTEAIRSVYDAVVKKVEKGEELTEEEVQKILYFVTNNPTAELEGEIVDILLSIGYMQVSESEDSDSLETIKKLFIENKVYFTYEGITNALQEIADGGDLKISSLLYNYSDEAINKIGKLAG